MRVAPLPVASVKGIRMDAPRFDQFARTLGHHLPRRHAFRLASAFILGRILTDDADDASARVCRVVGERCGKGITGHCCPGATCRRRKTGRGSCACRAGLTACNGYCFDIASDPLGCGPACRVCPVDTDCCNGACCPAGQRCCEGACTDLTTDDQNCGGCTQACPEGMTCCGSRCRLLEIDSRHCGTCGHACGRGAVCQQGQCVCAPGWADCGDGVCVNLQTDRAHCGRCEQTCSRPYLCQAGQCVCGGEGQRCVDTRFTVCGIPDFGACTENIDCCSDACDRDIPDDPEGRCAPCRGVFCEPNRPCCGGETCVTRPRDGLGLCGGCAGQDQECTTNEECCYADCTRDNRDPGSDLRTCLSYGGGRCVVNRDCRSCRVDRLCRNVCVGGRCRF